eukprot:gene9127-6415_t
MSTQATELEKELSEIIATVMARLPKDKKVTSSVLRQLLLARYSAKFSTEWIDGHMQFIESEIQRLSKQPSGSDSDDDSEESEEDDGSEESEEDEGSEESEEDEASEESEEDDGSEEREEDEAEGTEKSRKRSREDEKLSTLAMEGNQSAASRCKEMSACLRKVGYRIRGIGEKESPEEYLLFLEAEFKKHHMNPNECDAKAIKRYKVQRDVELLQQDGANLTLDRTQRHGRGFSNANVEPVASAPAQTKYTTSKFLDDD